MEYRYGRRTIVLFRLIAGVMAFFLSAISVAQDDLDYFLMDIQADGFGLAESLITYQSGEDYLVEFAGFLEAVEFPISRDDKRWSGWFRAEENHFLWDTGSGILEVDGYSGTVVDSIEWLDNDEGVFVTTRALEAWFNLRLVVNTRLQTITVSSSDPLPFQRWKKQTLAKYRYRSAQNIEPDIIIADEYHWATLPMIDLSTHALIRGQNGVRGTAQSGALIMGMDLLKHSVIYSGSISDGSNSSLKQSNRLTIERASATADTTLFYGVNRYTFGDVFALNPNLVVGAGSGRGFRIQRNSDERAGNMNRVTIAGDAPAGWEVELYRNDALIEFGTVDAAGRYLFLDQETPYGENIFVARIFGPQGQIREDRHTYWGGGADLAKGEYDFSISHIDFDHTLLDGKPAGARGLAAYYTTDLRYAHALTENMQLGAGYARIGLGSRIADGAFTDTQYVSLHGRMKLGRGVFIAEAANQLQSGNAWSLAYLTTRNRHNISFAHRFVGNFESPVTNRSGRPGSLNELTLSGPLAPDRFTGYTLRLTQRRQSDGTTDMRLFNRLGLLWGPLLFSNDLEYVRVAGNPVTAGQLNVTGRLSRIGFRGQLDYQLAKVSPLKRVSASFYWAIGERFHNNLVLSSSLLGDGSLSFRNILSARIRDFALTLQLSTNIDDSWAVGLGFNVHFGYDGRRQEFITDKRSLANTGRATMNLFVDDNNNGIRDPGEDPVSWAVYKDDKMLSASPGVVPLDGLPRYRAVLLETRHFKFDDPFLVPRSEVYELYTHAGGNINVDIAVVLAGDIEGYVVAGPSGATGVRGVVVMLYDSEGKKIATTRSEFDGFYSFTAVPGGDYEIRVAPKTGFTVFALPFSFDADDGYIVLDGIYLYE